MPLEFASGPTSGDRIVHAGVSDVLRRRSALSGRGIVADQLVVDRPHPIYDLRADEIARGEGLESAHATGYRYLVHGDGTVVAAGEVLTDAQGEATLLATLNYGNFAEATAEAFTRLEDLAEVRAEPFEVRLLRFSSVFIMAIWLKSRTTTPDIIYPLAPAPPPLEAERAYSAEEFLDAVVPLARTRAIGTENSPVP